MAQAQLQLLTHKETRVQIQRFLLFLQLAEVMVETLAEQALVVQAEVGPVMELQQQERETRVAITP